jgi:homoserine kinase type II
VASRDAVYYAGRILRRDITGISDGAGNEERLEEARRWLDRP